MGDGDEHYGTEKDGSKRADYCSYCYAGGAFTSDGGKRAGHDAGQRPGDDAGVPARAEALEVILICDGNDENKNRPISYRV